MASPWDKLHEPAYDNLEPGGWFEKIEQSAVIDCDDGSVPEEELTQNVWIEVVAAAERSTNLSPFVKR